jgi:CDP-diacylglycerol--glycerol-3-phosphate 3-phosphatidyltransferase
MYTFYDRIIHRVPVPVLAIGAGVFVSATALVFKLKLWVLALCSAFIATTFFSRTVLAGLHKVGVTPNHLTLMGLCSGIIAGLLLASGRIELGLIMALLCSLFDIWDGLMARWFNLETPFGGILDSVMDRMADGLIFGGLAYYLLASGFRGSGALAMYAAVSAPIVSYVRAKAESRIDNCAVNALGGRPERLFLLCYFGLTGYLVFGLGLICIFQTLTILRRIHYTYQRIMLT